MQRINQIGRKLDPDFHVDNYFVYPLCPFKPKYMKSVTYQKLRTEFNKHVQAAREKHNKQLGALMEKYEKISK